MREGCRDVRGEVGVPRICSTKLERCEECGLGLPILSAGGGVRPIEDTELLREVLLTSPPSAWSAIAVTGTYPRNVGLGVACLGQCAVVVVYSALPCFDKNQSVTWEAARRQRIRRYSRHRHVKQDKVGSTCPRMPGHLGHELQAECGVLFAAPL